MTNKTCSKKSSRTKRSQTHRGATAGFAVLLVAAGCDGLLDVELPGRVPVETLDNPAMAETLVLGVVADFECAFNEYVHGSAVFTNELITSTIWNVYNRMSSRDLTIDEFGGTGCIGASSSASFGLYRPLQTARFQAEDVYSRVAGFEGVTNKEALLARAAAYAGYSYVLLGEGYCEMSVAVDGGPLVSKQTLFQTAEERFTTAIQHASASGQPALAHMATLGRARARLDMGDTAGALADAQAIPEGFVYEVTRSTATPARENRIFQAVNSNRFATVGPTFRNLQVDGVDDPRVPVVNSGSAGNDGQTPQWHQLKYESLTEPMRLASWHEAQLIIAEAQGGQAAVDAINRIRADAGLPLFSSSDPTAITNQIIEERRRELWLEGHLINDRQRYDLPWEEGLTHKGNAYSDLQCFPLMQAERDNNPNI